MSYLYVPYELKDKAKELGCKYAPDCKQWFCDEDNDKALDFFTVFWYDDFKYDSEKIKLLKENGFKFSGMHKKWYTYKGNPFILEL